MANNNRMLEVSIAGDEEDEEEIELSLGLSIGGSFRNPKSRDSSCEKIDSEFVNGDADLSQEEAKRRQFRVRDREMRENEATGAERMCKRDKNVVNGAQNRSPPPIAVVPWQHVPGVMPCWTPIDGNVRQPVTCRSFRPWQGNPNSGLNPLTDSDSERNSGGNRKAVSDVSPVCSLSVVSDHRSTSQQGGSSSDTGSHSSQYEPQPPHPNAGSKQLGQSDYSVSSYSNQTNNKSAKYADKAVSSSFTRSRPTKLDDQPGSETQPVPVRKLIAPQSPTPNLLKAASGDLGKLPKPQAQDHHTPSFPQMPCVSTTGNGPNGKTINGFLYRYTQAEVSIVCVCHGTSFSPAEFVEHAGGKDVSHPLRHITVIPSAFG